MNPHPVIGIVAGEVSGDTLGARLMRALKQHHPHLQFIGVGGPQMQAEGLNAVADMSRLSVMGLVEVLSRLPDLFRLRDQLIKTFTTARIDAFIGIDAPDFNLRLAARLKPLGIKTLHYVSPSVWAWRQGRVVGIRAAVDHMMCLLPFEQAFYAQHQVPATFVGHPLADEITPPERDAPWARPDRGVLALLPGSRQGEVASLLPLLLDAARLFFAKHPNWRGVIPAIDAARAAQIQVVLAAEAAGTGASLPIEVEIDQGQGQVGRSVMRQADLVVLASGTATLEAFLLGRPMVVTYRLHWLTWLLARWLVRIPFVSLPNLLVGRALVPELLQRQATPAAIAAACEDWLRDPDRQRAYRETARSTQAQLMSDTSARAAAAVMAVLSETTPS